MRAVGSGICRAACGGPPSISQVRKVGRAGFLISQDADVTAAMSDALFAKLTELNVKFSTKKHAPVMTIEELLKERHAVS
jgi:hypothetical protein